MKYFVIRALLEEEYGDLSGGLPPGWNPAGAEPYVVIVTKEEWPRCRDQFDMGIELDPVSDAHMTKAEVNYDSLTGTFSIPDRGDPSVQGETFAFALDEKGVVFIDDTGTAERIIRNVQRSKRWRTPSLGRFLYDFLDDIVKGDLRMLEKYEQELERIEANIDSDMYDVSTSRTNAIRSDIRRLLTHYDQLIDLAQELEENENGFFDQDVLRYFRLYLSRLDRLYNTAASIRDYTMQIGDLYKAHLELRQNHIMTILTVVTTIFMPLTLITGWYGMNFKYMPELGMRWAYPALVGVFAVIVVVCLVFFKKKKWL